jgi:hypothetical protein
LHCRVARARAAAALAALGAVAALALSGGSSADPRTPAALPGLPPPFQTVAVLGDGGLTAGVDAYGDIVELHAPGPAGAALVDNPQARQAAGTVPADTGIVPRVSVGGGPWLPLWRADSVIQRYIPGTDVLRTTAHFGGIGVRIECAASGAALGCVSSARELASGAPAAGSRRPARISFARDLFGGGWRVHTDDAAAREALAGEIAAGRRWIDGARPLGPEAPAWAGEMYRRSLLVLRALADSRTGAVAAGARDGWAYVWPRDAGAVAIALASAGYRAEASRVAHFLRGLRLDAAARFYGNGEPVPGRGAQGDAAGWVAAAAGAAGLGSPAGAAGLGSASRAAGLGPLSRAYRWRGRADYQEGASGDYLGNALASVPPAGRDALLGFITRRGLVREAGDPESGLDSAAAWAVRPFPRPALFGSARDTLLRLAATGGRFGIVPSANWRGGEDPWTAPTAWSAWGLATLARGDRRPSAAARDRAGARRLLADLRRAATPAGMLPERVDGRSGVPRSTAPLAWSHAFAILALRQLWPGRRHRASQ